MRLNRLTCILKRFNISMVFDLNFDRCSSEKQKWCKGRTIRKLMGGRAIFGLQEFFFLGPLPVHEFFWTVALCTNKLITCTTDF